MIAFVEAVFAAHRDEAEIARTRAAVEREYAALPWLSRKYIDFIWWRAMRVGNRIVRNAERERKRGAA
jgi:hypothetical protein